MNKELIWSACTDPAAMLAFLEPRASERKMRLVSVACCRRVWRLMTDARVRDAVDAAERFADALIDRAEFEAFFEPIRTMWSAKTESKSWGCDEFLTAAVRHLDGAGAATYAASFAARALACTFGEKESVEYRTARATEEAEQCRSIRDIFGDPSKPFRFDRKWLSGDGRAAVEFAQGIDRGGHFVSVEFLADVLEKAGCRDSNVLGHCREVGSHVRGCWVVDALLERETAVRTGFVTDADWRSCVDPETLMAFLKEKGSVRQWRLFAVACCRRIQRFMVDERSRQAVDVAKRSAEGTATEEELAAARVAASEAEDVAHREEYDAEAVANFSITPEYAAAARKLFAARAASCVVCRDPRFTDAEAGTYHAEYWAPSYVWAQAAVRMNSYAEFGSSQGDARWRESARAADSALAAELSAQCGFFREIFDEFLGPPGDDGEWLPTRLGDFAGGRENNYEHWCLLPTPRT